MWICSQLGFYSIVRKNDIWHVRARTQRDINNLVRAAGIQEKPQRWPEADYRWRILVDAKSLGAVFGALLESIDYPNFKNRIHDLPDQLAKLPAYSDLWRSLYAIQEDSE